MLLDDGCGDVILILIMIVINMIMILMVVKVKVMVIVIMMMTNMITIVMMSLMLVIVMVRVMMMGTTMLFWCPLDFCVCCVLSWRHLYHFHFVSFDTLSDIVDGSKYVPRWVLHVLTPSAIIFLGDLIDEASETTNPEDQARFHCSAKS